MKTDNLVNRGMVRGGNNEMARFHLVVKPAEGWSYEELEAVIPVWSEEFGICPKIYGHGGGLWFKLENRRGFAVAPAIIRKALRIGWVVSTTLWDVGREDGYGLGEVVLENGNQSSNEAVFWRELALAQMYCKE